MNKENKGQNETSILFKINPGKDRKKIIKGLLNLGFHIESDSEGRITAEKSGTQDEMLKIIMELKDRGF